ncbi:hypothetical protein GCM10010520_67220 [Rhizobium viscosum]|uniref:Uncharacterized protein n=1 Tax=Rhizobium viscosum TaxID=1673 RepID=A0ABR9IU12_RHIVS|nr:hypothetical protein [Rhizobium viscosum]MBE1506698.1 hypothetical protein [Rhizobium viscosum]
MTAHLMIGLPGTERTLGDLRIVEDKLMRIDFPATLGQKQIERMLKDVEIISAITRSNNQGIVEILQAVSENDLPRAQSIASSIGLTEANLVKQGGQNEGLVVLVILGALALAVWALSDSSTPTPTPDRGNIHDGPDAGDAGTG